MTVVISRFIYRLALVLGVLLGAATLGSEAAGREKPAATAGKPAVSPGACRGGALRQIACQLQGALGDTVAAGLVVGAARVETGIPLALSGRAAAVLAGHLGLGSHPQPQPLAVARGIARDKPLLFLSLRLKGGQLHATADLYRPNGSFWLRAKNPNPGPVAHGFASAPLDAEVQSYLPKVPLVASTIHRAKTEVRTPVALSCGDTDGTPGLEIALVSRQSIRLGRIRDGKLTVAAKQSWNSMSPVSGTPLRDPIATATVRGGRLEVGSTDRAHGVRLGPKLGLEGELKGLPWPGGGCVERQGMGLSSRPSRCAPTDAPPSLPPALPPIHEDVDAVAFATYSDPDGATIAVRALRRRPSTDTGATNGRSKRSPLPTLVVEDSRRNAIEIPGVGAQVALADLDRDGYVEVLTTNNTLKPEDDALTVQTWKPEGLIPRYTLPVPHGVRALTVCPPNASGLAPIAVATERSLWIIH